MASKFGEIYESICGAFLIFVVLILPFLRPRYRKWGATEEEQQKKLPGDELVNILKGWYNHAITIKAPAAEVWPWIVQIGQSRGGYYSYELLENLVGCGIHNADRIIPEFLNLEVGDKVMMHPKAGYPYVVAAIEPGRALVLQIRIDTQTKKTFELTDTMPDKYLNQSWVFFLEELDEGTTRLISRSRNDWDRSLGNTLGFGFFGPISLMMDRKMLVGIKQRAESAVGR